MGQRDEHHGGMTMQHHATARAVNCLVRIFAALAVCALAFAGAAWAQSGEPIKIGFSMALTGGLAPNGKSALLAQKIWEEDVNAKGGLLGRPVKLIYYDDKSSPAEVPSIYTKLLYIDKVDLIIGPYATAMIAPAMPIVIQRKKTFIGLLGLAVNSEFNYPNYFAMIPSGPDAKKAQLKVVYDKTYPPSTTDFAPIVRAIQATNPDLVVVCSYPPDSVGMVRAVNEINFRPKMIGGGRVGLQNTA